MKTYYVGSIPISDELYHYGIKGQKWGIRRYQNTDGTLTAAGKERYRQTSNLPEHRKAYGHYADKYYSDKRYRKRVDEILNNDNRYSKTLNSLSSSVKQQGDRLYSMFSRYDKELTNSGNPWTGDGTELHWYLEDKYPDYRKASEEYDNAVSLLSKTIKESVKTGMFDSVFNDNVPGLMYRYDSKRYNYSESSDGRAIALGYMLGIRDGTDIGVEMEDRARESKRK